MKKIRQFILLAVLLAAACGARAQSFMDERAKEWMDKAYETRGDARALAYLGSLYGLWDGAEYDAFFPALKKLAEANDAHPMVAAKARNLMRFYLMNQDRWGEAQKMMDSESFISEWLVMAPFANENKSGFGETFGPETCFDLNKTFKGMDRDVSWRRIPRSNINGITMLDSYIDPGEDVCAYLAAFIYSAEDKDCVLRCSFAGAHRIWLNSSEIASNPAYSPSSFDQFSYPARLRAGWNLLLVKSCHHKGAWAVRARLTDRNGAPLQGVRQTNDVRKVEESLKSVMKKTGSPSKGFVFFDPARELEKASESGGWEEGFIYGLFLFGMKNFDETEHKDVDAFRSALDKKDAPERINYFIGEAESDLNLKREAYEKSGTGSLPAEALMKLFYHYSRRGLSLAALKYLDRALELRPGDAILLAERCSAVGSTIAGGMAEKDLEGLYAAHPQNQTVARDLLWIKESNKDFSAREKILLDQMKSDFSDNTVAGLFELYASQGKQEDAAGVLKDYIAKVPYNRDMVHQLADYFLRTGNKGEAKKTLSPLLEYAPDWSEGRRLLGEILLAAGDADGAIVEFEKALILNPQNDNLKRRLSYLKPEEEPFYQAFKVPQGEIAPPADEMRSEPIVVMLDNTFVSVELSGLSTRYEQFIARVQNSVGAQALSSFPITFDPDWQDVRVLDASVTRADGTKIRAQSYVTSTLSEPEYQLYYRSRQLVLTFPGLRENDTVSVEYLLTDTGEANMFGHYFGDIVPFGSTAPVMIKKYTLRFPDSLAVSYKAQRLEIEPSRIKAQGKTTYQWVRKDIPKTRPEAYSPGFGESASYLHISTFGTWEELGKWYSSFVKDQWDLGAAAKEMVRNISASEDSVTGKVKAIHKWVVSQTRYVGLEFGVHGYKPYKASQIFERRFGDCKDKAILLASMLREAGIEADMVLVRTRNLGAIGREPASLATFNHAICYVPALDLFLDGTAEYSGVNEIPYQDRGCEVLVVGRDGMAEARTIPESTASNNVYSASYRFEPVMGERGCRMKGSFTVKGQEAQGIRSDFKNPDKQKEILEKELSYNYPASKIDTAEFSDMKDINRDIDIKFEGTINELAKPDGKGASTFPLWIGAAGFLDRYCTLKERVLPLVLPYPSTQSYTVTYSFPPGARLFPPKDENLETRFGSYSRTSKVEGNTITVTSTAVLKVVRVSAADYGSFRDFSIGIDKLSSERIKVQW